MAWGTVVLLLVAGGWVQGTDVQVDGHRVHQQLNMRGPHHPRSPEVPSPAHHGHYQLHRPAQGAPSKITQDTKLLRDEEHIREDLEHLLPGEDTKKMSPEELEFYYFKLHDFDNNTKLDGLEILQAIQHVMHSSEEQGEPEGSKPEEGQETVPGANLIEEAERLDDDFSYFVELIDKVLEEDDLDNDGFLSYIEYVKGRKKDQIKREQKNRRM
ncbi:multiple coagulation factor deficiency protein 2 homolog [Ischnura elegans]|uniref:multiple coagulation factor deficiency protein 2 homolog n=1 Tax=Ischnura elegans TaxID=197161 RepID=UPI001ED8BBAD|nr:multiple coagulation factor deficiency protein 2 homolog [Ischnura elegans]XP_046384150.1 multiple coagulation factor deficiency protein 2 homolog [Ischnura elegans]